MLEERLEKSYAFVVLIYGRLERGHVRVDAIPDDHVAIGECWDVDVGGVFGSGFRVDVDLVVGEHR